MIGSGPAFGLGTKDLPADSDCPYFAPPERLIMRPWNVTATNSPCSREKTASSASDGPGFAVDEDAATLGEKIALPPFLEPRRAEIVANLKPL